MMHIIRQSPRFLSMMAVIIVLAMGAGCKSKKKAMEAQAAEKARMEQEAAAQRQKDEEARRQREAEEQARRNAEANAPAAKLDVYFNAIANSGNTTAANGTINEALGLFASPDTPVLIVISQQGSQKDYDRPTTIRNYLNYLKDVKKNPNKIGDLKYDSSGKITEMELIKQY